MKAFPLALLALIGLTATAQAHEIWVERDAAGPARIYLGEPGDTLPEGGDPEFEKLKSPKLVPATQAAQARKAGYIEVAAPAGDVRVTDDSVFEPWGEDGKKQGVIYYARAGRADTKAVLPLEIVPTAPGADSFTLIRDGKPVPAAKILAISPDKWSKSFTTDAQGNRRFVSDTSVQHKWAELSRLALYHHTHGARARPRRRPRPGRPPAAARPASWSRPRTARAATRSTPAGCAAP